MIEPAKGDEVVNGQDRRGRLLEAAIVEFSRRGHAGARIQAIAEAAGVNKQLIYHYFGDKAQLERAVIAEVIRRQDDEEVHLYALPSFKEFMEARCLPKEDGPLAWLGGHLLAGEALEHRSQGDVVHFEERRARFNARFLRRVRESQNSNELDPAMDPNMLALVMLAIELIPRVLPNVTRLVTGFSGDGPRFAEH